MKKTIQRRAIGLSVTMIIGIGLITFSVLFQVNLEEQIVFEDAVQAFVFSRSSNFSSSVLETDQDKRKPQQAAATVQQRPSRILMGVFTTIRDPLIYRENYRRLATLSEGVMCSLNACLLGSEFVTVCRIIYTFVVAGRDEGPTKYLQRNKEVTLPRPTFELPAKLSDLDTAQDFTVLNILENMEDGKSETWLNFASQLVEETEGIDYIAKTDGDTLLYLGKFVQYLDAFLPPAPYNSHVMMGKAAIRHLWDDTRKQKALSVLKNHYDGGAGYGQLQLYFQGQFYGMSPNVAQGIVHEATLDRAQKYKQGYEDSDIGNMADNLPHSLKFLFVKDPDMFWRHPVKLAEKGFFPCLEQRISPPGIIQRSFQQDHRRYHHQNNNNNDDDDDDDEKNVQLKRLEIFERKILLIVKEFSVPPDELFVECPNEAAVPLREVPMVIRRSSGLQSVDTARDECKL